VYLIASQFVIECLYLQPNFFKQRLSLPFTLFSLGYLWITYFDRSRKVLYNSITESIINRVEHLLFAGFLYLAVRVLIDSQILRIKNKLSSIQIFILINLIGVLNEFVQYGLRVIEDGNWVDIPMDTYYDIITNLVGTILIFLMFETKNHK
jgi:hypothetical protein